MDQESTPKKFEEWALVELFGHQKIAGLVTEATLAGGAFLRVDVPTKDGSATEFTRFFSPGAIYSISPISRQIALGLVANMEHAPVKTFDLAALQRTKKIGWDDGEAEE